ncbi:MAG TPA: TetR/AcrR family transcriptional regulator [Acidimicrobiia bacterium]
MARYRPGIETRDRILAATRELLGEVGLDGTTIKAICGRARVQPGSFYNLFESKDEAVLTVIGQAITAVDPHPEGVGKDSIAELVDAYLRFVTGQPDLAKIYLQLAVSGGLTDPALAHRMLGHHHRRVGRFSDAMRRDHPELSPDESRLRTEHLLATLNGLAFVSLLDADFDLVGHVQALPFLWRDARL